MKICPQCKLKVEDSVKYCPSCGISLAEVAATSEEPVSAPEAPAAAYAQAVAVADPYDHTAELSAEDVSRNKIFGIIVYLLGIPGIIITLLAAKESPFAMFHVRNALKLTVLELLLCLVTVVLFWTIIVPLACIVLLCVFLVIEIICFVQACKGEAKDAAIVRSFKFLN